MNILQIKEALAKSNNQPRFCSFLYRSKKHNELARYTLLLGFDYKKLCESDLLELEIQLKNATGIKKVVIQGMIDSLKESINAKNEGREHVNYTKKGQYTSIAPGLRVNLTDMTCEILGLQIAKAIIEPGEYKETRHKTEETRLKAELRKELKIGRIKTLSIDLNHFQTARINGEVLEIE